MSARAYLCPACGAQVDEQARHCRYCAAPVATVRCATCFHMNVPEAGYCSGCGRQLGLEPVSEVGELPCPVCHKPLDAYPNGTGILFDCGLCGGQFVEHALLHEMLERHEHISRTEGPTSGGPFRPDPHIHYIPCPACSALMNRKNFGGKSGVIVDVCKKHGTWFDLGELPRVLAFVAGGGLARSRAHAAEEDARLRREASAAAASFSIGSAEVPHGSDPLHMGASLAKMFVELLLH